MLKKYIFLIFIILAFNSKADFLQAIKAYEAGKFAEAKSGFEQLMLLANEDAIFNLAVMNYHGEGQDTDYVEALALFLLSAELGHHDAAVIAKQIGESLDGESLRSARLRFEQLQRSLLIKKNASAYHLSYGPFPAEIHTPMPIFRDEISRKFTMGYIVVRYLVDGAGKVQVADAVDVFPEGVFEREVLNTVKRWTYQATGKNHLMTTQLNFWTRDTVNTHRVSRILERQKLWEYSIANSPEHQEVLGSFLNLVTIASGKQVGFDSTLPFPQKYPNFETLLNRTALSLSYKDFVGEAELQADKDGVITEIVGDYFRSGNATSLLKKKIKGAKEGRYWIQRVSRRDPVIVQQIVLLPEALSPLYWWSAAAKNGNKNAQRILAAKREDWQFYLLQQNDPVATTWHGARLWLDGDPTEGRILLNKAIEQGYDEAKQLLHFLTR